MKTLLAATTLSLIGAFAWADGGHAHASGAAAQARANATMAQGEVTRVDRAQGRLTLRHGPIANLDMPPMTMVFRVQDPAWLDGLKPGDRIRFEVERIDGAYTVTRLERIN